MRFYRRLNRVLEAQARHREFQKVRNSLFTEFLGKNQSQLRLKPAGRVALEWARLAQEIARVTSMAQGIWAEARAKEDVPGFLPVLADVIRLRQEEGAALAAGAMSMTRCWMITNPAPRRKASARCSPGCGHGWWPCAKGCWGLRGNLLVCQGISGRRRSCALPAIWPRPSAMTGSGGGWTLRCIRFRRVRR